MDPSPRSAACPALRSASGAQPGVAVAARAQCDVPVNAAANVAVGARGSRPLPPGALHQRPDARPALDGRAHWHLVLGRRDAARMDQARQSIDSHPALQGRTLHWHVPRTPQATPATAEQAARAAAADNGLVVAVGGDGTVNAVAQACLALGVPMGVITLGTFNFFTRQQRLPGETAAAVQALVDAQAQGRLRPVSVGLVNGQVFLVNASLGLYPRLLAERERATSRFGRHRAVALLAGLLSLLRPQRGQVLSLCERDAQGRERRRMTHASTLFVGNNALQLRSVGVAEAEQAGRERLVVTTLAPCSLGSTLSLLWRAARGRLGEHESVDSFSCTALTVEWAGARVMRVLRVAFDGERSRMSLPLRFEVSQRPLWLVAAAAPVTAAVTAPVCAAEALPAAPGPAQPAGLAAAPAGGR